MTTPVPSRVLIVGSGGREHALAWALAQSSRRPDVFIAPGNAGTASVGTNVDVAADDVDGLLALVEQKQIDLTIVGPEQPLVVGLVDRLRKAGRPVVGPTAAAAQLEGSKEFAKAFMQRHGIPTARHATFNADQLDEAVAYVRDHETPIVLKADGLAAGKGVIICHSNEEAERGLHSMLTEGRFGVAGATVVVEEFMHGEEASVFALTDGTDYVLLAAAQDHKRIGEGDSGPNTGGMGAYAPAPVVTEEVLKRVRREVIEPTLQGMAEAGHPYTGILYCGLMLTDEGPRVVEYNCRLGDPETQVVLPLMKSDAYEVFERVAHGRLADFSIEQHDGAAACIVMCSRGYPGSYPKGLTISGLADAAEIEGVTVFHAGTQTKGHHVATSGGRVLGVTGRGENLKEALDRAYEAVGKIEWEGSYARRDIGQRGLRRLAHS